MTETWGRTDYVAVAGIHNDPLILLGFPQAYISQVGDGTDSSVIHDQWQNGQNIQPVSFASITDGSSNTAMIWEDNARPVGYNHARQIFSYGNVPVDGVFQPVSGGGGAWADCNSDTHIEGSQASGIRGNGGICMINCSTDNEVYSFHPGGTNVCFADGSVHWVKETINPAVFFALITRKAGELISSDQY